MCSVTEHVAEGILKYSLIPYAKSNDIEIKDLIQSLYNYYNDNEIHKQFKSKVNNFQYLAQQNNTQKPDLEPQSYYPPLKDRYDYENNCYSC